ncbi:UNVERIFIED_CONTAM: hypothetical protein NY603_38175, partial [Bacteroidetes bacterium 56_B9]
KQADNIAVMQYGRLVEQGTHKELIEAGGQYAAMVRAQDLGAKEEGEAEIMDEDDENRAERQMSLQRTKTAGASTSAERKL